MKHEKQQTVNLIFEKSPSNENTVVLIKDFISFCQKKLKLEAVPDMYFHAVRRTGMTTGSFDITSNTIHVLLSGRLVLDTLRTIAHEMTHAKQLENGMLEVELAKVNFEDPLHDIDTPYENQAYTFAGNFVKEFVRTYKTLSKDEIYVLKEVKVVDRKKIVV